MNIVWFSWKDINHPLAGGAELVSDEIRKHLARDGHNVTFITAKYETSKPDEEVHGVRTIRAGGRYSVYAKARRSYKSLVAETAQDIVIDEMNTIPFMAALYAKSTTNILLTYQLARKVWFHQMVFPFSVAGYLLEPLYLRQMAGLYKLILTESESTKADLVHYGFQASNIHVFRIGMGEKLNSILPRDKASDEIIFLGALRPMKQPLDAIKAFEIARDEKPELSFIMAGSTSGEYAKKVLEYVKKSRHSSAITVLGRVSDKQKKSLLQKAAVILVTSIKEGWGLIVTEANNQGTPAIVYDADGLRDSVLHNDTGLVLENGNYTLMGQELCRLLDDPLTYERLRMSAFEHSKQFTFDNSYSDFLRITGIK